MVSIKARVPKFRIFIFTSATMLYDLLIFLCIVVVSASHSRATIRERYLREQEQTDLWLATLIEDGHDHETSTRIEKSTLLTLIEESVQQVDGAKFIAFSATDNILLRASPEALQDLSNSTLFDNLRPYLPRQRFSPQLEDICRRNYNQTFGEDKIEDSRPRRLVEEKFGEQNFRVLSMRGKFCTTT